MLPCTYTRTLNLSTADNLYHTHEYACRTLRHTDACARTQSERKKRESKSDKKKKKKKEKKERKKAEKRAKKESKKRKHKEDNHQEGGGTSASFDDRLAAVRALAEVQMLRGDGHRPLSVSSSSATEPHRPRGDTQSETGELALGHANEQDARNDADAEEARRQSADSQSAGHDAQERESEGLPPGDSTVPAVSGAANSDAPTKSDDKPAAAAAAPAQPIAEHGAAMTLEQWRAMVASRPEISKVAKGLNAGNEETIRAKVLPCCPVVMIDSCDAARCEVSFTRL